MTIRTRYRAWRERVRLEAEQREREHETARIACKMLGHDLHEHTRREKTRVIGGWRDVTYKVCLCCGSAWDR